MTDAVQEKYLNAFRFSGKSWHPVDISTHFSTVIVENPRQWWAFCSFVLFATPRVPTGARILCTFLQHWVAMTTSLTEGQTWRAMPTRAEVLSKKHLKTKATKSESLPVSEKRDLSLVCGLCIVFWRLHNGILYYFFFQPNEPVRIISCLYQFFKILFN